jgi:hypothetical protein
MYVCQYNCGGAIYTIILAFGVTFCNSYYNWRWKKWKVEAINPVYRFRSQCPSLHATEVKWCQETGVGHEMTCINACLLICKVNQDRAYGHIWAPYIRHISTYLHMLHAYVNKHWIILLVLCFSALWAIFYYEIWGFHDDDYEEYRLLGCGAV